MRARRAGPLAALLLCSLAPASALGQQASKPTPFGEPRLRKHPQQRLGRPATPTRTATITVTPTPAPTVTATPTPTATARPKRSHLPATGSDTGLVALAGMSLLGFGFSLRLSLALGDARRDAA